MRKKRKMEIIFAVAILIFGAWYFIRTVIGISTLTIVDVAISAIFIGFAAVTGLVDWKE